MKQEVGDNVRPCFRVGRPSPLIRWRKVRDNLPKCLGWGEFAENKPLSFCRSLHTLLSDQDPLVSDLVARARSYSMRHRNRVF